jgi:hypothetical protein
MNTNYTQLNTGRFDHQLGLNSGNQVGVGTTTQNPAVNSSLINLKPGQVFTGQITDIRNGFVSIALDQQTIQAKFEGAVNFCIGEVLQLVVKENANNKLIISPYQQQPITVEEQALYKALDLAELPATDKNIDIVGLLLKNNMPVDKNSIHGLIALSLKFPETSIETLITMAKYKIDITPENITQFQHYKDYEHQLTNDIKQLTTMLPETIESVFDHMGATKASSFLGEIFNNSTNHPIIEQVLKQLNNPELSKVELKQVLQGSEFKTAIKDELMEQWSLRPEQLNADEIQSQYNRMESQLQLFAENIQSQSSKLEHVTSTVKNMQDNINFMKNLNDNFIYAQLPLQLGKQVTHSDLYVYTNRRSSANRKDGIHLLLHLDMEHLGQTNISIKLQENNLNLSFVMSNQAVFSLIESHLDELNQSLSKKGFLVHSQVSVEEEARVDFIEDFLAQGDNKPEVKQYSFDMRV